MHWFVRLNYLIFGFLRPGCWGAFAGILVVSLVYAGVFASRALGEDGSEPLSPIRALHVALLAVLLFLLASAAITSSSINNTSITGTYTLSSQISDWAIGDVASAAMVAVLLLVARGWQITRLHLDTNERRHVIFLTILYTITWSALQLFGGIVLMFLLLVCYAMLIR